MKIVSVALFSVCIAVRGVAMDASELVIQDLDRCGLRVGYNSDRDAYIAIADSAIPRGLNEAERNKAAECAYMKALSKMAMADSKKKKMAGSEFGRSVVEKSVVEASVVAKSVIAKSLLQCESNGPESGYEVSLALVSSDKVIKTAAAALSGNAAAVPKHSGVHTTLSDWVEKNYLSFLGPMIVHDSPSHFWVVGVASQEADDTSSGVGCLMGKAAYTAESALGGCIKVVESMTEKSDATFGGDLKQTKETFQEAVSQHHEYFLLYTSGGVRLKRQIELTPYLRINPDSSCINWFIRTGAHPATGKRIRVTIAAIDSNDLHLFASPDVKPDVYWHVSTKR